MLLKRSIDTQSKAQHFFSVCKNKIIIQIKHKNTKTQQQKREKERIKYFVNEYAANESDSKHSMLLVV